MNPDVSETNLHEFEVESIKVRKSRYSCKYHQVTTFPSWNLRFTTEFAAWSLIFCLLYDQQGICNGTVPHFGLTFKTDWRIAIANAAYLCPRERIPFGMKGYKEIGSLLGKTTVGLLRLVVIQIGYPHKKSQLHTRPTSIDEIVSIPWSSKVFHF